MTDAVGIGIDETLSRTPDVERIMAHMRDEKGIAFNLVSEANARRFLEEKNFYFKVKAFAKNYEKYNDPARSEKYVGLDFGHLVELSQLDKTLRSLVLSLTLDIEHCLKVRIDSAAMRSGSDRYCLSEEFLSRVADRTIQSQTRSIDCAEARHALARIARMSSDALKDDSLDSSGLVLCANNVSEELETITGGKNPEYVLNGISAMRDSPYSKGLVKKYGGQPVPYWVLLELITFGNVVSFYRMCFGKSPSIDDEAECETYKEINRYLSRIVTLRNAAAHSDCLLNGLSVKASRAGGVNEIVSVLRQQYGICDEVTLPVKSIQVAMDLASTLICYGKLVPNGESRQFGVRLMQHTANRFRIHADWFVKNYRIDRFLAFLDELLNSFASALTDS